jgi:AP-2 complex subunit alpha
VILLAGDWVTENVWHRAAQIVTNRPETHEYAAEKLLETIQSKYTHEVLVSLSSTRISAG